MIVFATVLETEDTFGSQGITTRGYNAILQVHRYLKGQGGEYLAVMRYPVGLHATSTIRQYEMACTYDGSGEVWQAGIQGYFMLSSDGNGTYTDHASRPSDTHYLIEDGQVTFYSVDNPDLSVLPVDEFEAFFIDMLETDTTTSPQPNKYPLKRFLHITTESGNRYRLNPDYSLTWLDPKTDPLAISKDGSHVVFRYEDGLGFQYYHQTIKPEIRTEDVNGYIIPQSGEMAYFSPDSNFVAVQEAEEITIYRFDNHVNGGTGSMGMQIISQRLASWHPDNVTIVWSADSRTIAFQDTTGIWLLDIYHTTEWQQISVPTGDFVLLDLSTSGRYVRYQTGTSWQLLDTKTGQIRENVLVTPDEHNLIYLRDSFEEDRDRQCTLPLFESCPIELEVTNFIGFLWYRDDQIALLQCYENERCSVRSYVWRTPVARNFWSYVGLATSITPPETLAYHVEDDLMALVYDNTIIEFEFYEPYYRDVHNQGGVYDNYIDLTDELDNPIVALEWGQPIFYEYQP